MSEPTVREAIGRFVRRAGGLTIRFEDGRPYVRLPSEWIDDLASVLHTEGEEGAPSEERLATERARIRREVEGLRVWNADTVPSRFVQLDAVLRIIDGEE